MKASLSPLGAREGFPQLVYVHGWGSSPFSVKSSGLRALAHQLGYVYRAIDFRTNGGMCSLQLMASRLAALISTHGGPTILVASSVGCAAALHALATHGLRCDSVILSTCPYDLDKSLHRAGVAPGVRKRFLEGWHGFSRDALGQTRHSVLLQAESDEIVSADERAELVRVLCPRQVMVRPGLHAEDGVLVDVVEAATSQSPVVRDALHIDTSVAPFSRLDARATREFLRALECAHGEAFYGAEVHLARLKHDSRVVRSRDTAGELVGAAYLRGDGKWEAIGVVPNYRRAGVSQGLLWACVDGPKQYAELLALDEAATNMLIGAGFRRLVGAIEINSTLAYLGLSADGAPDEGGVYRRRSLRDGSLRDRVLFVRGIQ